MKAIYYDIFEDLRNRIEGGEFVVGSYIPSENVLVEEYECSHNTLRKALSVLRLHGYVQPIQGKGVKVIWKPDQRTRFLLGGIESFAEAAARTGIQATTEVASFELVEVDAPLAQVSGFAIGEQAYRVERVRRLNGMALIYDTNYFLSSVVHDLTPQIVQDSVYLYLENVLGVQVTTSQRTIQVEHATARDGQLMDLLDFSMVVVVTNHTFSQEGVMFETTFSRHRPDFFTFHDTAVRGY